MKRSLYCLLALFWVSLLSGCLNFESQTLSYRYDKASDTLRIFQDYRGIFGATAGGDASKPLTADEIGQLESVLQGQRTFFFANWIFEYNREDLEEQLAELGDPAKRAEKKIPAGGVPKLEKLMRLVLANVRVENGPCYLDAKKKLCGVQSITVTNFSAIVETLNECTSVLLEWASAESEDPAYRAAIAKYSKASKGFVQCDGNALTLHWPIAQDAYDEEFGVKAEDAARLVEIRAAGLGINYADEVVTFKLGKSDDEITRLTLRINSDEQYTPNVIEHARRQHVVKDTFDPAAAAKEFLLQQKQK